MELEIKMLCLKWTSSKGLASLKPDAKHFSENISRTKQTHSMEKQDSVINHQIQDQGQSKRQREMEKYF